VYAAFAAMKSKPKLALRPFFIEFLVYGALVSVYYFLVLHFLGNFLNQLFQTDRRLYTGLSLTLIIGQGMLLEMLTRLLLALVTPRRKD
jgi:hypothetical protein